MPVVSDFTRIVGDKDIIVPPDTDPDNNRVVFTFNTGGRHAPASAYIILMVRGMNQTSQNAKVLLNKKNIGVIFNNKGGRGMKWQTQIIHFDGGDLNNGDNDITFMSVPIDKDKPFFPDHYVIRNVICHFHQDV